VTFVRDANLFCLEQDKSSSVLVGGCPRIEIFFYAYLPRESFLYRGLTYAADEPVYIGQTTDLKERDIQHQRSKKKSSFEKMLHEVGRDRFDLKVLWIIESTVPCSREAGEIEAAAMKAFKTYRPGIPGYNQAIALGGSWTSEDSFKGFHAARAARRRGVPLSIKHREAIKQALNSSERFKEYCKRSAGVPCPRRGHAISEENRKALSERMKRTGSPWNIGLKWTDERRKRESISRKGRNLGRILTDAQKSAISQSTKLAMEKPDVREKCSIGGLKIGYKNAHQRWHVARGITNPQCKLCCLDLQ
jgi:hypothetical protein